MKKVAIVTDFVNFDNAYSLCRVVRDQGKMLHRAGYQYKLLVREHFNDNDAKHYPGAEVVKIESGRFGKNRVEVISQQSEKEIDIIEEQMGNALSNVNVVLTHDLIYQPDMWKHHIAARRIAKKRPDMRWLHWVHSATNMGTPDRVMQLDKTLGQELVGQFPYSYLVAMHAEEIERKRQLYGYERDQVLVIPNPIDFLGEMHPLSQEIVHDSDLMQMDIIAVYPCRLDRGKQPHIICEIFEHLKQMGARVKVVICDFHSTAGDKKRYREKIKEDYGDIVLFTSDHKGYSVPHRVVMDLMEVGDVMVHPSRSESDPLILHEAMWKRMGLMLNYDLSVFHQYAGYAQMAKFSSSINLNNGMPGDTITEYGNRNDYMHWVALCIKRQMEHSPIMKAHQRARLTRSLDAVWRHNLHSAIEGVHGQPS
jgi:glycosyltransferase involved in cell wall biosynthesis